MKHSIGFIGGGRVTKILLQGFKNKDLKYEKVVVTDTNQEVLSDLKKQFPEIEVSDAANAAEQDIVFIALHPPVVMDTLELIKGNVKADATVISLAPKINMPKTINETWSCKESGQTDPECNLIHQRRVQSGNFSEGFDQQEKREY